jgi:hypothetical protein
VDKGFWREPLTRLRRRGRQRRSPVRSSGGSRALWGALGLAIAAVTVLGVIGFTRYQEGVGTVAPLTTRVYLALQLFVLESGSVVGPVPWELDLARLLAPVLAAYAFLRLVAVLFREQVGRLRLRFYRDHQVVAGLGSKGTRLATELLGRGDRVVAIEVDGGSAGVETVRALGGVVVVGDARSPTTLARARVGWAGHLVVLGGGDGTNIEVAAQARERTRGRPAGSLHCVVHLENPELCRLLCVAELERHGDAPIRVDFVNVHAAAAQALLGSHPPAAADDGTLPRVAVIGTGPTARHVLLALARTWASGEAADHEPPVVTLGGADAQVAATLRRQHPELGQLVDVRPVADPAGVVAAGIPAVVYVCPDDDEAAAANALELRGLLAGHSTRIVVVLEERAGLARLLEGARQPEAGPSLVTFGLLDEACRPEILLSGTTEVLARALHGAYVDAVGAAASPDDPALRPWSELPESLRESNRDQAAHVAVKLAAVGRTVGPLADWTAARRPFGDDEIETMAMLEHERWVAERRRAGWQPGPRDIDRRTTPYLVSWDELSEDVREKDRLFIRRLPHLLASVGLQALRLEDGPTQLHEGGAPAPAVALPAADALEASPVAR